MSIFDMSLHQQMGSDRDLQPSASSVSLPSVRKAPKQRRISIGSLFRRKKDSKRKSMELNGGVEGISSHERIHSEMCADKNSIFSTNTSSDNGLTSISKPTGDFMDCPLCLLRHPQDRFPDIMTCHHRSCVDCLRQYLRIEISESRVNIRCPECTERFHPHDIRLILSDDVLMEKYEEFMLRQCLVADPDCRWCPAPDCGYAVIAFGCARCPKLTCGRKGCGTKFCYHCKQIWHPKQTCDVALWERAQRLCLRTILFSPLSYRQESRAAADEIKPCPRCAANITKIDDGSCNHMTCTVCGCEFCWLCMKEISNLHYLSFSGCSLWGKKPWSRKKKILWQLGTLVGAPVGIALIAGIALPAMIIGIPVYVGQKIHDYYEGRDVSKRERTLAMASGVTLAVIVSPVVAAVTIGIGVPTMLAYVYGVVPISLCRNGDDGVSAGNGKGVRIEFRDESDINVGGTNAAMDTSSVAEARHNPSIGEGSVSGLTGSLGTSGSHMDGADTIGINLSETVSTIALAAASITGSLSGSAMVNCFSNLQGQGEVQKERCSLSRESGTVSLGRVCDNGSTKAMAGSILNSFIPLNREGYSMEVQVDIESKPFKFQPSSGGSSVDDRGAACGHTGRASSGLPEGKSSATKWSKEATGRKKSKSGKLRKKDNMKINETREDMDAQLLQPQSTNLSDFEVPSLSDGMPSVAVSHCNHFSYLDSMRMSCSHHSRDCHAHFAAVNTLPEVENGGLKHPPHQCSSALLSKTASCSEVPQPCHVADEHGTN